MMLRLLHRALLTILWLFSTMSFAQSEFRVGVEVRDKYTQRPVMSIISVLPVGEESEIKGTMLGDAYVVIVKPTVTYQVLVASQDYKTYRQTYTFDNKGTASNGVIPFVIELDPLNPPPNVVAVAPKSSEHTLVLVDHLKRTPISNATVVMRHSQNKQPVLLNKSGNGRWAGDLKEGDSYAVEVSAPEYESYRGTFKIKSGQLTEIVLTRLVKQLLQLKAIDGQTGKPVAARFKLTDEVKESYTGLTQTDEFFSPVVLVQKTPYQLTVSANGYRNTQATLKVFAPLSEEDRTHVIKLYKSDVEFRVKVADLQTQKPLEATIKLVSQPDKKVVYSTKSITGIIIANPALSYTLEVTAPNYSPYQQTLTQALTQVNAGQELAVSLNKLHGESYLILTAIDAVSKQPLAATFKVSFSTIEPPAELKSTPTEGAKYKISEPDVYKVETIAVGYQPLRSEVDAEEMAVGQQFQYEARLTKEPKKLLAQTAEKKLFTFKVVDGQTRKNISDLKVKINNLTTKELTSTTITAGAAQANLALDQTYAALIEAAGYESFTLNINAGAWAKRGEFLTNIALVPLKKTAKSTPSVVNEKVFENLKAGQSVAIEDNVYFDKSSYTLRPEASKQLDNLVFSMKRNPKLRIEITGHTDNVGDPRLNLILSENRAKVIANYLIYKGIEEARISHKGAGQSRPVAPNDTEENMRRNRRVEFAAKDS